MVLNFSLNLRLGKANREFFPFFERFIGLYYAARGPNLQKNPTSALAAGTTCGPDT
jgi:hypothetical protein